jgi:hypothetical protein
MPRAKLQFNSACILFLALIVAVFVWLNIRPRVRINHDIGYVAYLGADNCDELIMKQGWPFPHWSHRVFVESKHTHELMADGWPGGRYRQPGVGNFLVLSINLVCSSLVLAVILYVTWPVFSFPRRQGIASAARRVTRRAGVVARITVYIGLAVFTAASPMLSFVYIGYEFTYFATLSVVILAVMGIAAMGLKRLLWMRAGKMEREDRE